MNNQYLYKSYSPWKDKCEIVTLDRVQKSIDELVRQLSDSFALSRDIALIFLIESHWNLDKIIESYFEDPDYCAKLGLPEGQQNIKISDKELNKDSLECPICAQIYHDDQLVLLYCGHYLCRACLDQYIELQRSDPFSDLCIRCCFYDELDHKNCTCPLLPSILLNMENEQLRSWYQKKLYSSYIQESSLYYQCVNPTSCDHIIYRKNHFMGPISCSCGTFMCYKCHQMDHQPATCTQYTQFMKIYNSKESEWLNDHIKICPNCKIHIERNAGCNHMTCPHCHYEFCWICLVQWSKHGGSFYQCNRMEDKVLMARAESLIGESTASVNRNGFCIKRYKNYKDTYLYILSIYNQWISSRDSFETQYMNESYVVEFYDLLVLVLEQLLYNYLVLSSTYIFINQKDIHHYNYNLFVNSQGILESNTDILLEFIQPILHDIEKRTFNSKDVDHFVSLAHYINEKVRFLYLSRQTILDTQSFTCK